MQIKKTVLILFHFPNFQLREEISKCEALKLQNIQRFIEGMRHELEDWWKKCFYSEKQRNEFKHFHDCE